jgi:DNA polymerase-2
VVDSNQNTAHVFILTGEWMDRGGSNILRFIGKSEEYGVVEINITDNKPVFFIQRDSVLINLKAPYTRKEVELKTFARKDVDALYFNTMSELRQTADELHQQNIITFESDIDPARRYLMERFINAQIKATGIISQRGKLATFTNPKIEPCNVSPNFVVASLDIETSGRNNRLYSIAGHITRKAGEIKQVYIVNNNDEKLPEYVLSFPDEKELLIHFIKWFNEIDPDIIIGWHVIGFDLMFLESKCGEYHIPFDIARSNGRVSLRTRKPRGYFASIAGRVVIDGPPALRSSFFAWKRLHRKCLQREKQSLQTGIK